jgi:hypothetical protein
MRNRFQVGAVGRAVQIGNLPRDPELTPSEALELAAFLVASAAPLHKEDAGAVLGKFLKMLGDVGSEELAAAAAAELE